MNAYSDALRTELLTYTEVKRIIKDHHLGKKELDLFMIDVDCSDLDRRERPLYSGDALADFLGY
jgi:hypothetical protein